MGELGITWTNMGSLQMAKILMGIHKKKVIGYITMDGLEKSADIYRHPYTAPK